MTSSRQILTDIFSHALNTVRGSHLIEAHSTFDGRTWEYQSGDQAFRWAIPPRDKGRVLVVGAGKAAGSLALGLEHVLGERIDDGCIIIKYGHTEQLHTVRQLEAGHPVPDLAGENATRELLRTVSGLGPSDRVFAVLTGGASALLVAPPPGISLADKAIVTELLLRSGAGIDEINTVRKHISLVKGGRLLQAIGAAETVALLISDVPDRNPGTIGSAPLIADSTTAADSIAILRRYGVLDRTPANVAAYLRAAAERSAPATQQHPACAAQFILADSRMAIAAASRRARELGFAVLIVDAEMDGETHASARNFAAAMQNAVTQRRPGDPPLVLIAAGETTLKVTGNGRGGRNQEFALVTARELAGRDGMAMLAAGTDGTDGPTDAAGAFADETTVARSAAAGLDLAANLANNDSYRLFQALGDLHMTGPTGTNVMDLVIGLVGIQKS
jgi:glycerate-2-kinase